MRPVTFSILLFALLAVGVLLVPVPGDYTPTGNGGSTLDSFPACWRILEDRADFLRRSGTLIHLKRELLIPQDPNGWFATGHDFSLGGWRPAAGDSFDLAEFYDGARARFPRTLDTATGRLYWPAYPNLVTAMVHQGETIRGVAIDCSAGGGTGPDPRSGGKR